MQQCVEEQCKRKIEEDQLYLIEHAVRSAGMNTQTANAMDRVWTFRKDCCNALKMLVFGIYTYSSSILRKEVS